MASVYQKHVERWNTCTACPLCQTRTHVVLARGEVPATVVLLGEAPGQSEDALGRPFVGPAGKLLDRIIADAVEAAERKPSMVFTNLVCCIPLGEDGNKVAEPPKESIKACAPRLQEFLDICKPKLLVLVGTLAAKHAPHHIPSVQIDHPAFILRANLAAQPLLIRRATVTLADAFVEV